MNSSLANTASGVFLDANILIEILLDRNKSHIARKILEEQKGNLCISSLTAHLAVYFGSKIVDLPVLRQFLADYTILALEAPDFEWAFMNVRGSDFEDALQLGVAIRHGCERFVTFDKTLCNLYKNLPAIKIELAR